MLPGLRFRRHVRIESVITRAQALPPGDYRRSQIIGELATADFKASFERAAALIRTADPASMTLGAEMIDQLFVGMREGRRFARQAEELLRELCRPTQEPEVLCAALHPYAQLSPDAGPLLHELLDHPDGRVRTTAAQLIATAGAEFAEDRQVDSLLALLDRDPDPGVRAQAAEGLEFIVTCYAYVPQRPRITDALMSHVDDPIPGVRASALVGVSVVDVDMTVKRLVAELAAADVAWQFVDSFNRLPQLDLCAADLRAEALRALRALDGQGWPQEADPARFPVAHERAEMLARAIEATAPRREPRPDGRVRAGWPRR
jgi:HEAT repeats